MIDKIAEAIYREFEARPLYAQVQMNGILARELAVAALKAMRPHRLFDLPEAVALAGEDAIDRVGHGSYTAAHEVFASMIDAMLVDEESGKRIGNPTLSET